MAYSVSNDYFLFFEILKVKKISVLMFFLFVGTMSKSAQIGLHGWLPEAMEGPTPVSALLHAATMVTAGVYLFIRCAPLLEYCKNLLFLVFFVGCVTALYTSLVGMYQTDIKKIIAYSTCSQLGYMICICGLSGFSIALFHLFNHAFFKALLFLCAGAIIHANSGEQDIRKMGGLLKIMPVTYSSMLIGSLSLAGFPFFSGYYSKDLIIESVYCSKLPHSLFVYCLLVLVALFTSLYSFRVIYLVFLSQYNGFKVNLKGLREPSLIVIVVYIFLSLFSIFSGYLFRDLFVGLGVNSWSNCFPTSLNNAIVDIEFLNFYIKLIPTVFSFLGFSTSFLFFYFSSTYFNFNKKFFINKNFTIFFCDKCYFDYIYSNIIIYC
jgi:NADH-ubiquinone oxidoreductase chain 5